MDNKVEPDTIENIETEKAAIAALLAAAREAQQAVETPAPEPVESAEDINGLVEKQKALATVEIMSIRMTCRIATPLIFRQLRGAWPKRKCPTTS